MATNNTLQNKDIAIVLAVTAAVLLVPLIAMQFTEEVDWKLFDFIIMGSLIAGTGLLIALASRKIENANNRMAVILVLLGALFLVWAELAVGIFGTPLAGS